MPAQTVRTDESGPLDDDVVIVYANGRWETGLAGGLPSMSSPTCDDARALVQRFARAHGVDVWLSRDGRLSHEVLVRCRADTPKGRAAEQGR
jgi:hypothetical protein